MCMFPTNSGCLIGVSDAFSAFCIRVFVIFPMCSLYSQQKRAYSALHGPGPGPFCFTSTEARWLIRVGDGGGGGGEVSTADTARRDRGLPPEQWKCLRRCPLAIAQRLVEQLEAKEVQLSQASSTSLLMISSGLT